MPLFRLLAGIHIENGPPIPGEPPSAENPLGTKPRKTDLVYYAGDVFESAIDLEARHNQPGSRKFERVIENPNYVPAANPQINDPVAPPPPVAGPVVSGQPSHLPPAQAKPIAPAPPARELEKMTLRDLQAIAAEEEIDLKGAKSTSEAAKVLRSAGVK